MENIHKHNFDVKRGKLKTKEFKYVTIIIIGSIFLTKNPLNISRTADELRENIYNSMLNKENKTKAYNRAIFKK